MYVRYIMLVTDRPDKNSAPVHQTKLYLNWIDRGIGDPQLLGAIDPSTAVRNGARFRVCAHLTRPEPMMGRNVIGGQPRKKIFFQRVIRSVIQWCI